jgi:hypothetical protein
MVKASYQIFDGISDISQGSFKFKILELSDISSVNLNLIFTFNTLEWVYLKDYYFVSSLIPISGEGNKFLFQISP